MVEKMTSNLIILTSLTFLVLSLIILLYFLPNSLPFPSSSSLVPSISSSPPSSSSTPPPRKWKKSWPVPLLAARLGLIDESGSMTVGFEIARAEFEGIEFNSSSLEEELGAESGEGSEGDGFRIPAKYGKFRVCEESKRDHVPCMANVEEIERLNLSSSLERFERHCPGQGKGLDCLVPAPKGYRRPIPWPQSRDEVWLSNVPYTPLVEDKGGRNSISRKKDKIVFPGGGRQFIHGAEQYLNQISQMVPDIAFGIHTRVAFDIGCGVANFGAFLLQRNVTTLSIAPKDVHENRIQFALERGIPAMISVFAKHRLPYPSQAFDLMHCSRCRIDWTQNDGIWLLEADRMLRAGGYFVWVAQPVHKHEENLQEQWKEMQNLTACMCWTLVKKEGYIAIWRKPLNNSCYLGRGTGFQPPLCDIDDDPDNVWYINLNACITRLPENGYGANVSSMWRIRLHNSPDRLQSIRMDAYISRKEILKAESKYWKEIIDSYVAAFHWKEKNFRNMMDMRAGFGGFAAALHDLQIDCWVMNVVPVSGFNTLPVIYDRGLVGVMHDWCEPFDTYPRTYDLLHAAGLFSIEQKRNKCNISTIMLEMDRMLNLVDLLTYVTLYLSWMNFKR